MTGSGMQFNEAWFDTCSKVGNAARMGNLERMRQFISEKCPVDASDNRGWRPLHEATVGATNTDCLTELLQHEKTDINWVTFENETALLLACKRRQEPTLIDFVRLLLEKGANPNIPDNEGDTPLLEACRRDCLDLVKSLVEAGADVNACDFSGWSPLHEAATKKDTALVNYLLKQGANIDVRDECGMSPAFSAAQHGHEKSLEALLFAAKERGNAEFIVNMGAEDWATPLMIAAQQGFVTCVKMLLEYGANPNLKTSDQATALHMAVQANNTECLEILLQRMSLGEMISSFHPLTYEYSGMICPLHLAVEWENHASLKALLQAGFSPDSLYACSDLTPISHICFLPEVETVLSYACYKANLTSIAILLQAGANPSPAIQAAFHPALRALGQETTASLKLLIESGTNLNYQRETFPSNEVFFYALMRREEFLHLLLRHGCDPNLAFQTKNEIFQRCASRHIKRNRTTLRAFMKMILYFLINSGNVYSAFSTLSTRFPEEDVKDILQDLSNPSPLQHMCCIRIRQHLYTVHGNKLPNVIPQLNLPSLLMHKFVCPV